MILTHAPSETGGDWYVLTKDEGKRFHSLLLAMFHLSVVLPDNVQAREVFVHWSMLTDVERDRVTAIT